MVHATRNVPPLAASGARDGEEAAEILSARALHGARPRRTAYIDAAWRRCTEMYRLDPGGRPVPEHIGGTALKHRREALALFERVGWGEMRRLFEQLNQQIVQPNSVSARFALMLVDAEATILEVLTNPASAQTRRKPICGRAFFGMNGMSAPTGPAPACMIAAPGWCIGMTIFSAATAK